MFEKRLYEASQRYLPPIISSLQFQDLAENCLLTLEEEIEKAKIFLDNLGSIMVFPNDKVLSQIIILDTLWLAKMLSTLLSAKEKSHNGLVDHVYLKDIWKYPEFPQYLYPYFLQILKKFEIAYDLSQESSTDVFLLFNIS